MHQSDDALLCNNRLQLSLKIVQMSIGAWSGSFQDHAGGMSKSVISLPYKRVLA